MCKKMITNLFSAMRSVIISTLILLIAITVKAENLTVSVNDGTAVTAASLEAAIAASKVALGDITKLEISSGEFLTSDWEYLKANTKNITQIYEFIITDGITSVADMPDCSYSESFFCRSLQKLIIHKLKNIPDGSFSEFFNLVEVDLPDVLVIGSHTFFECMMLSTLKLPSVTTIGNYAFWDCYLSEIQLGKTPPSMGICVFCCEVNCFFGTRVLRLIDTKGKPLTDAIYQEAFAAYSAVEDGNTTDNMWRGWYIGDEVELMTIRINGQKTEYKGISLEEAIANSSVELSNVINLEVEGNLMDKSDFTYLKGLNNLYSFTLGVEFDVFEFFAHPTLREFRGLKLRKLEDIDEYPVFKCNSLESIYLPATTTVGASAFSNCHALTKLSLPSVRSFALYGDVFLDCVSLSNLQLGVNPPSADEYTFYDCPSPRYLELVDVAGQPLVGDAFEISLAKYLADDDGDTSDDLWWGWTIVHPRVKIRLNGNDDVFEGVSVEDAIANSGEELANIIEIELMSGDISAADSLYMHDNLIALQRFTITAKLDKLHRMLPILSEFDGVGVGSIDAGVFKDFAQLTTVNLPAVTSIGDEAFAGCGAFSTLRLGAIPPVVGVDAFKNCPNPRYLQLVDADGNLLVGNAFIKARERYMADATRASYTWHGWTVLSPCGQTLVGDTTATACSSFAWRGVEYTTSGDYEQTLITENGCDSVVTLHLIINEPTTGDTTATACGSFAWRGVEYTASGDYEHTLTASNGCDSVVTLHLTINEPTTGDTTATACGSFAWRGVEYTASGDYEHTLTASNGCDSVVTLHLTITEPMQPSQPSGLFDVHSEPLSVYPNPTKAAVQVEAAGEVCVYSVSGMLLQRVVSQGKVLLDFSNYPEGLYIIRVNNAVAKVIKR